MVIVMQEKVMSKVRARRKQSMKSRISLFVGIEIDISEQPTLTVCAKKCHRGL